MNKVYEMREGKKHYWMSAGSLEFEPKKARDLVKRLAKRGHNCLIEEV